MKLSFDLCENVHEKFTLISKIIDRRITMKRGNVKFHAYGMFYKGKNSLGSGSARLAHLVYSTQLALVACVFMACGAGSGDLSTGEPLNDALARFNMAIHSSDEAAALELVTQDERDLLSQDGYSFSDKYRKGVHRLRLSTLMNNKELALDSDGHIVGMLKAIEEAHARGRRHKFHKRAGLSKIYEDEKKPIQEIVGDQSQEVGTVTDEMPSTLSQSSDSSSTGIISVAPDAVAPVVDSPVADSPVADAPDIDASDKEQIPVTTESDDGFVDF
jgi:hypothetical protein